MDCFSNFRFCGEKRKAKGQKKQKTIPLSISSVKKYVSQFLNFKLRDLYFASATLSTRHTYQKLQSCSTCTLQWKPAVDWILTDRSVGDTHTFIKIMFKNDKWTWHKSKQSIVYPRNHSQIFTYTAMFISYVIHIYFNITNYNIDSL